VKSRGGGREHMSFRELLPTVEIVSRGSQYSAAVNGVVGEMDTCVGGNCRVPSDTLIHHNSSSSSSSCTFSSRFIATKK